MDDPHIVGPGQLVERGIAKACPHKRSAEQHNCVALRISEVSIRHTIGRESSGVRIRWKNEGFMETAVAKEFKYPHNDTYGTTKYCLFKQRVEVQHLCCRLIRIWRNEVEDGEGCRKVDSRGVSFWVRMVALGGKHNRSELNTVTLMIYEASKHIASERLNFNHYEKKIH